MNPFITTLKNATTFMRSIAFVTIFAHLFLILSPSALAISDANNRQNNPGLSVEAELSENYIEAIEKLSLLQHLRKESKNTDVVLSELKTLKSKIVSLDKKVQDNFSTTEVELTQKQLPDLILKRHTDMMSYYKSKNKAFMSLLAKETQTGIITDIKRGVSNFFGSKDGAKGVFTNNSVTDGVNIFKTSDFKRIHQEFDPDNLGSQSLGPNYENEPKTTKQEFIINGFRSSPQLKLSALGDFSFDKLEEATDPLYLAESDEIQLTQSIRDKAAELDHDAVKIYHWVRNNVEWLPSWGAIQDAELTLEAERGNSMDIASLTLSLFRASQIPARYVHGTIDVSPERFKNWVGGFSSEVAASDYASSGGIPLKSLTVTEDNGNIEKLIRMEHIWVEVATDFQPSRGAINYDADTWIQLDPSFKQYEIIEGLDIEQISGVDVEQIAQDYANSGIFNEEERWSTGFDSSNIQSVQIDARIKIEEHITSLDNPTILEITGGKKVITKESSSLPSSLPNPIVIVGTRYDKLPDLLQQKIEFSLDKDNLGRMIDPIIFPYAKLNNEKVNISFKPATQDDMNALVALMPADDSDDISLLPTSLPSSIRVVPELKVNNVIVKTGDPIGLGEELPLITGISFANRGLTQTPRTYNVVAGSFLNINVFAGSVSPKRLRSVESKLLDAVESSISSQPSLLIHDDVMSDYYYGGALSYYSEFLAQSYFSGLKSDSYFQLAAGYGTLGFVPKVNTLFGSANSITQGGIVLDIPLIGVFASKDGDESKKISFNTQIGLLGSTLEHIVPEEMLKTEEYPVDAISAVKAISKANNSGDRIYSINASNISQVLPSLGHDQETLNEIVSSVNSGNEIITHTQQVNVPGWSGFGYIVLDTSTGDGSYKISGGFNGGTAVIDNPLDAIPIAFSTIAGGLFAFGGNRSSDYVYEVDDRVVSNIKKLVKALGRGAIIADVSLILLDRGSSFEAKALRLTAAIMGFYVGNAISLVVLARLANPWAAAVMAAAALILYGYLLTYLLNAFLASIRIKFKKKMLASKDKIFSFKERYV